MVEGAAVGCRLLLMMEEAAAVGFRRNEEVAAGDADCHPQQMQAQEFPRQHNYLDYSDLS